jgi:hypothetical protein|tara:strand:+ start:30 stop:224 length:195 start_codon:yes stop_codon:yes gene_type:complete
MFNYLDEKQVYELYRDKFRHDLAQATDAALHLVEQGKWGIELKRELGKAQYAYDRMSFAEYKLK